jgi:phosphohistidine swiveling domain-containing protein
MYKLHFSVSSFSLLALDMIFDPRFYGGVNYRVINNNGTAYSYLTKKGIKETYDLSKNLLNKEFSSELIKKSEVLNGKMKKYKTPKLTGVNVFKRWYELVELFDDFDDLYRFYEQPFQQALEEKIIKKCKNKNQIVELLKKPSLAKKINFDEEESYALNLLIKMGRFKLELHESAVPFVDSINIFGKFLAKKYNLSLNQALHLRKEEFEKALNGKNPNINLINERLKGYALIPKNKKWHCFSGKDYLYWKKKIEKNQPEYIRGDVSYPGRVKGRAVIHLDWIGGVDIPKGSVLVCGMTNPQIVPFLKNASAIVADEGGLTCHAAIISRELKIPCIVGTGNGTRLIKKGDLIEVDANKGEVKIIKK